MPVIYVKLRAIFQHNGSRIDFFSIKWEHYFIFGFLCLIKPDCDRISTLEPGQNMTKKMLFFLFYLHEGFESLETSSLHTMFCVGFVAQGEKDGILVFKRIYSSKWICCGVTFCQDANQISSLNPNFLVHSWRMLKIPQWTGQYP